MPKMIQHDPTHLVYSGVLPIPVPKELTELVSVSGRSFVILAGACQLSHHCFTMRIHALCCG